MFLSYLVEDFFLVILRPGVFLVKLKKKLIKEVSIVEILESAFQYEFLTKRKNNSIPARFR
jgi:hypothetical protein